MVRRLQSPGPQASLAALPHAFSDAIFQVNLYGPHEVTRHAVRAMRARGRGRIVNCSSAAGFKSTTRRP